MSEQTSGEKTEEPTPKKRRDARNKGQVARSQEVVTSVSLMSVIAYIWLTWESTLARLVALMDYVASLHGRDFQSIAYQAMAFAFNESIAIMLPILLVALVFGIFANYLQFGNIFALENLKFKAENVSLIKGLKRVFSVKQLVEMLKSIAKIIFLSCLLFYVMKDSIAPYTQAIYCNLPCVMQVTSSIFMETLLYTALAFVIVSILDFTYQRYHHNNSLKMTKEEVKREYKQTEGDPQIKGERRKIAKELVMSDDIERTSKATALVVNPTHFAVAIDYKPEVAPLPFVVAKGRNMFAHELRKHAELAGVPVFRNVPLTRSLYADTEIGAYVPDEWFNVVAEIIAWVNQNKHDLYSAPLRRGVIDMENGDHQANKKTGVAWNNKESSVFPDLQD